MMPLAVRPWAVMILLLSLTAPPVDGASQQGPPRGWWRTEAIVKELGLTPEQSARLESIFETAFPELRQEREELERLEGKLSRLIQDDSVDEATIARQIDRVETARASGNKTRSLMLMRMHRVLTQTQRVRLEQLSRERASAAGRGGPGQDSKPGSSQGTRGPSGAPRPR